MPGRFGPGTQRACQQFGGFLTDVRDAERINEPRETRFATGIDGVEQVTRGYLGETLQLNDLLVHKAVEIRRRTDQPLVDQLLDDLVAQAVDIHRSARYEMDDRLLKLRLTGRGAPQR